MGFGIKSIGKAAKKVGKKIGKAAKKVVKEAERAYESVGKPIDRGLRSITDPIRKPIDNNFVEPSLKIGSNLLKGKLGGAVSAATEPLGDLWNDTLDETSRFLRNVGMSAPLPGRLEETPVMPDIDAEAVARARRRAAAQASKSGGRSSTILTGGSGTTLIG